MAKTSISDLDDAARESAERIPKGSVWEHKKTGNLYMVDCVAFRTDDGLCPSVIYRPYPTSGHSVVFDRPETEFLDGRFARRVG